MTIKRLVKNPIPLQNPGEMVIPPDHPTFDPECDYEGFPEPLRTAILEGRVDFSTLPYPIFWIDGENEILNPLINLEDYR
jgi:hypothetical protein